MHRTISLPNRRTYVLLSRVGRILARVIGSDGRDFYVWVGNDSIPAGRPSAGRMRTGRCEYTLHAMSAGRAPLHLYPQAGILELTSAGQSALASGSRPPTLAAAGRNPRTRLHGPTGLSLTVGGPVTWTRLGRPAGFADASRSPRTADQGRPTERPSKTGRGVPPTTPTAPRVAGHPHRSPWPVNNSAHTLTPSSGQAARTTRRLRIGPGRKCRLS